MLVLAEGFEKIVFFVVGIEKMISFWGGRVYSEALLGVLALAVVRWRALCGPLAVQGDRLDDEGPLPYGSIQMAYD